MTATHFVEYPMVDTFDLVAHVHLRSDEDLPLPIPPGEDPPPPIEEPPDKPIVGPDGPVRDPGPREPQRL